MATASQNNLTLLLNQQDVNGVNILNRSIGAVSFAGVVGEFRDGILLDTAAHAQTLPTTILLQYYLKNTHATGIITVIATPQGGASATLMKVGPGGVFAHWAAATSGTAGFTALSLTADTASTTFEQYMGG